MSTGAACARWLLFFSRIAQRKRMLLALTVLRNLCELNEATPGSQAEDISPASRERASSGHPCDGPRHCAETTKSTDFQKSSPGGWGWVGGSVGRSVGGSVGGLVGASVGWWVGWSGVVGLGQAGVGGQAGRPASGTAVDWLAGGRSRRWRRHVRARVHVLAQVCSTEDPHPPIGRVALSWRCPHWQYARCRSIAFLLLWLRQLRHGRSGHGRKRDQK